MTWWEQKTKKKKRRRALAYERYSAQGRQENSIKIQQDAIHAWAERNDVEIIAEYEDAGVSGLTADRPGFQALLAHVRRSNKGKEKDIDYVICLDVSRWGRFQNTDESGHYEKLCADNGVKVVFVGHGDIKHEEDRDDDSFGEELLTDIGKPLERVLAKKHSKDLSRKVFAGTVKVAQQGFRAGGPAPFGTVRFEVNEQRKPVGIMKPKQYKSYPNNRVQLVPNKDGSAGIVYKIFDYFTNHGYTEKQIATMLSEQGIPTPKGGQWQASSIRRVLQDEQYAGSVVYNKTSSKLKSKTIRNPRELWIIKPDSYKPVVERAVFDKAQEKLNLRDKRMSREEILAKIRPVFKEFGMLSHQLLNSLPDMPAKRDITSVFGSLPETFQSLYPNVLEKVRNDVRKMIAAEADELLEIEDFLVINQMFSIKIVPVLPFPHGYGHQWYFRIDKRSNVDITLGVPIRDIKSAQILGYFPFLRVLADEPLICIADSSSFKIGLYGQLDLRLISDLIHWTNFNKKETKK